MLRKARVQIDLLMRLIQQIFLHQRWLLAASFLTSNNMIIVSRHDSDHIISAYHQNPFPYFHGSVLCTEAHSVCRYVARAGYSILRVPILILFCCVRHLSTAVTIFSQPEVSFCSPFIEMAINLRNTFFPFNSDASRDIYDLILTSFVLEYVQIEMNRH